MSLSKITFKQAVFIFLPLVATLGFLPRQTSTTEAAYLYGYSQNYNYSYTQAPAGTGRIYQTGGLSAFSSQCLYSAKISWTANSVNNAVVTVRDPDTGIDKLFASGSNGTQDATWIEPGKAYLFMLWDYGRQTVLSQVWINGGSNMCSNRNMPASPYQYTPPTANNYTSPDYYSYDYYRYQSSYSYRGDDRLGICGTVMPGSAYYIDHCSNYPSYTQDPVYYYGDNNYNYTYPTTNGYYPNIGDPLGICPLVQVGSTYDLEHCR